MFYNYLCVCIPITWLIVLGKNLSETETSQEKQSTGIYISMVVSSTTLNITIIIMTKYLCSFRSKWWSGTVKKFKKTTQQEKQSTGIYISLVVVSTTLNITIIIMTKYLCDHLGQSGDQVQSKSSKKTTQQEKQVHAFHWLSRQQL